MISKVTTAEARKNLAVLVSIEDFQLLQQMKDMTDVEDAWKVKDESGTNIKLSDLRKELDLQTYTIEFKRSAAKALRKLPNSVQKRIFDKLVTFENSPPPIEETKLKGNNPFHRIRVGDYRIVYEFQNEVLVILIIKIGHRKDIYKHLS